MVVNKDVEGLLSGHWEKSKQSGYVHLLYCSSDGRFKVEGTSARLVNFPCTGRIIGAGFDMVCWSPSMLVTTSPLHLSPSAALTSNLQLHFAAP